MTGCSSNNTGACTGIDCGDTKHTGTACAAQDKAEIDYEISNAVARTLIVLATLAISVSSPCRVTGSINRYSYAVLSHAKYSSGLHGTSSAIGNGVLLGRFGNILDRIAWKALRLGRHCPLT